MDDVGNKALATPQRLKVLGYVCQVERADYPGIALATGLSTSEISRTVKYLLERDYIVVSKGMKGRYAQTHVAATASGRRAMKQVSKDLRRFLTHD